MSSGKGRGRRGRDSEGRSNRVLATCLAACTLSCLLTACAAGPSTVVVPDGAEPSPAGVTITKNAPLSNGTLGTAQTCNPPPLESLRPAGPLPPPGHMPAGSTMAAIQKNGYLRVGVDQTIYLTSYRDPDTGQLTGFDVDVARQIAKAIFGDPNRIKFVAVTQAQRLPAVYNGLVDMTVDSITITCERETKSKENPTPVDFSTDYFNAGQQILVPSSSTARDIADLGHAKVCAAAGTTSLQEIAAQPSHPTPVSAQSWTDCLVMLQQGQVAAVSTDNSVLAGLAAQDPQTKLAGPLFTSEAHGIAISKQHTDLVRFVNAVLEQMRTDGMWTALYEQWYGTRLGPVPAPPAPSYQP